MLLKGSIKFTKNKNRGKGVQKGAGRTFVYGFRDSLSDKETLEQRFEANRSMSHGHTWGKSNAHRGHSQCNGHEVGASRSVVSMEASRSGGACAVEASRTGGACARPRVVRGG